MKVTRVCLSCDLTKDPDGIAKQLLIGCNEFMGLFRNHMDSVALRSEMCHRVQVLQEKNAIHM